MVVILQGATPIIALFTILHYCTRETRKIMITFSLKFAILNVFQLVVFDHPSIHVSAWALAQIIE